MASSVSLSPSFSELPFTTTCALVISALLFNHKTGSTVKVSTAYSRLLMEIPITISMQDKTVGLPILFVVSMLDPKDHGKTSKNLKRYCLSSRETLPKINTRKQMDGEASEIFSLSHSTKYLILFNHSSYF